ncbi:MAG TPA: TVP38/TMEM64 family protein [Thermoanaerobaculia bacterium]
MIRPLDAPPATPVAPPHWRRLILIVAAGLAIGLGIWFSPLRDHLHPAQVTAWLRSLGATWWTPFVFLGLYVVCSITFIPVLPLAVAGTLIWGWWWGGLIELVAATIAALPPYLISRSTASAWIEAKIRERFGVNYDLVRVRATSTLFLLRLVPVLPFSALNYLAGLAAIRPIPYTAASAVGMIPSVFIFTYFVDAIASGVVTMRQASLRVFLAGSAMAALFIAARILAARIHHKHIHEQD